MNANADSAELSPEQAWAAYEPSTQRPWDLRLAAHLHRRAGFGASWPQLQQTLLDGPARAVERLLNPEADLDAFDTAFDQDSAAAGTSSDALRAWWLRRMVETPHPLRERMTLFWHGHFGVSLDGVKSAELMTRHLQTLRAGALGGYRPLLASVMDDPALYLSLFSTSSRKSRPDRHVARQLLYVYGPGSGAARESDVEQAARALTGRFVLRGELRFFEREFDGGSKTLLGQTGDWSAGDAVRIVLDHPATAESLVRKLYAWFVSESDEPSGRLLAPLAEAFRRDDDLPRLIATMLRSNLFFSPRAWRRRIKSPVEFAVGLVRAMEANVPTLRLAQQLAELGQDLGRPPTSAGWAGGRHWLNPATMLGRLNLAAALLAPSGAYEGRLDPQALLDKHGWSRADGGRRLVELLLQEPRPASPAGAEAADLRQQAAAIVQSPEYQLA